MQADEEPDQDDDDDDFTPEVVTEWILPSGERVSAFTPRGKAIAEEQRQIKLEKQRELEAYRKADEERWEKQRIEEERLQAGYREYQEKLDRHAKWQKEIDTDFEVFMKNKRKQEQEEADRKEYIEKYGADILNIPDHDKVIPAGAEKQYAESLVREEQAGETLGHAPLITVVLNPFEVIASYYEQFATKRVRAKVRKHFDMPLDKPISVRDELKYLNKLPPERSIKLIDAHVLTSPVAIRVPERIRFQHCYILAPTGTGKTQALQNMIWRDLIGDHKPAVVVVDPKGLMVRRLRSTALIKSIPDNVTIIDITAETPPALNLFAQAPTHLSPELRELIENQTIDMLEYIFSASDFKLTQKQSVGFTFLARLMFKIPGANLNTMLDVVDEEIDFKKGQTTKYLPYIKQLDDTAQRFFAREFFGEFKETKSQIKSRIYSILRYPRLAAIFNAPTCALDWFTALQSGKIILVNTDMDKLGTDASQVFGRYVIAMTYVAARARKLVRAPWKPAYLYIDEAQLYVDENKTTEMLSLVREYKLGITLAFQQMQSVHFNDNLRNAISTNTSMKLAASTEGDDIRFACRDLRTEAEFLQKHEATATHVNFACFIRNTVYKKCLTVSFPIGTVERDLQMSPSAAQAFFKENTAKLAGTSSEREPIIGEAEWPSAEELDEAMGRVPRDGESPPNSSPPKKRRW